MRMIIFCLALLRMNIDSSVRLFIPFSYLQCTVSSNGMIRTASTTFFFSFFFFSILVDFSLCMITKRTKKVLESSLDEKIRRLREAHTDFTLEVGQPSVLKADFQAARESTNLSFAQREIMQMESTVERGKLCSSSPPTGLFLPRASSSWAAGHMGKKSRTRPVDLSSSRSATQQVEVGKEDLMPPQLHDAHTLSVLQSPWMTCMEEEDEGVWSATSDPPKRRRPPKSVAFARVIECTEEEEKSVSLRSGNEGEVEGSGSPRREKEAVAREGAGAGGSLSLPCTVAVHGSLKTSVCASPSASSSTSFLPEKQGGADGEKSIPPERRERNGIEGLTTPAGVGDPLEREEEEDEEILQQIQRFTASILPELDRTAEAFMIDEGENDEMRMKKNWRWIPEEEWWKQEEWHAVERDHHGRKGGGGLPWCFPPQRRLEGVTPQSAVDPADVTPLPLFFFIDERKESAEWLHPPPEKEEEEEEGSRSEQRSTPAPLPRVPLASPLAQQRAGEGAKGEVAVGVACHSSPSFSSSVRESDEINRRVPKASTRKTKSGLVVEKSMAAPFLRSLKHASASLLSHGSTARTSGVHRLRSSLLSEEDAVGDDTIMMEVNMKQRKSGEPVRARGGVGTPSVPLVTPILRAVTEEATTTEAETLTAEKSSVQEDRLPIVRAMQLAVHSPLMWFSCATCHSGFSLPLKDVETMPERSTSPMDRTHFENKCAAPPRRRHDRRPTSGRSPRERPSLPWRIACPQCGAVFAIPAAMQHYYQDEWYRTSAFALAREGRHTEGCCGTTPPTTTRHFTSDFHCKQSTARRPEKVSVGVGGETEADGVDERRGVVDMDVETVGRANDASNAFSLHRVGPSSSSSAFWLSSRMECGGGDGKSVVRQHSMGTHHASVTSEEQGCQTAPTETNTMSTSMDDFSCRVSHAVKGLYFTYLWDLSEARESK